MRHHPIPLLFFLKSDFTSDEHPRDAKGRFRKKAKAKASKLRSVTSHASSPLDRRGHAMLMDLIRHADMAPDHRAHRLAAIWSSHGNYLQHVAKRIVNGDVKSEAEYADKTFAVLAGAQTLIIAMPANGWTSGKMELKSHNWIVLLGDDGRVVTSYPFDPDKATFEDRHRDKGDTIHEYRIDEKTRALLARVFG